MKIYKGGYYSDNFTHPINQSDYLAKATPEMRLKWQLNKSELSFPITRQQANLFRARALNLFERKKFKPMSQILTYRAGGDDNPYKDLNRYLTNLRKNYHLNAYLSALEITQNNTYHFHLICDMPFIKVAKLNAAWSAARNEYSTNAIRDVRLIKSEIAVIKYCSDYLTKGKSKDHNKRKFTSSRNTHGQEFTEIPKSEVLNLIKSGKTRKLSSYKHDYGEVGRLYYDAELKKLIDKYQIN